MSGIIRSTVKTRLIYGNDILLIAPQEPEITTDDVFYSLNLSMTATDVFVDIYNRLTEIQLGQEHVLVLADITDVTATNVEVNYLDNARSNIQQQIDDITDRVLVLADITDVNATATEVNYLEGARSNIQQQIDALEFGGDKLLASVIVNTKTVQTDLIYTVPNGLNAIITQICCVCTAFTRGGGVTSPELDFGLTAPYNDFINSATAPGLFSDLTGARQIVVLGEGDNHWDGIAAQDGAGYRMLIAGDALNVKVTTPTDYTALTLRLLVFGVEFT